MDMEDDIYGDDIYGGSGFGGEQGSEAAPDDAPKQVTAGKTAEVQELERQMEDKDNRIADLEDQLHTSLTSLTEWKGVFKEVEGVDGRVVADPATAAAELRRIRAVSEKQHQQHPAEDASTLRQREAALQMQLAERNLENIELRRHAHTARQCADPAIAQVRQLLLDPAVRKEFERMKAELEAQAKEVKGLQEELQAVQFSQDSKAGRMLMAKCRALQDENEEMGKELAEGKIHALERQVALSKTYVEDMRAKYLELEDHAHILDTENEDMHQQVFMLRRQLREAEVRSVSTGRERPLRSGQGGQKFQGPPKYGSQAGMGIGGLPGPPGPKFEMSPDGERKRHPREAAPDGYNKRLR